MVTAVSFTFPRFIIDSEFEKNVDVINNNSETIEIDEVRDNSLENKKLEQEDILLPNEKINIEAESEIYKTANDATNKENGLNSYYSANMERNVVVSIANLYNILRNSIIDCEFNADVFRDTLSDIINNFDVIRDTLEDFACESDVERALLQDIAEEYQAIRNVLSSIENEFDVERTVTLNHIVDKYFDVEREINADFTYVSRENLDYYTLKLKEKIDQYINKKVEMLLEEKLRERFK